MDNNPYLCAARALRAALLAEHFTPIPLEGQGERGDFPVFSAQEDFEAYLDTLTQLSDPALDAAAESWTATQTSSPSLILERIAALRQNISMIAGSPEVLALAASGTYHPDLRLGDAIQALDELTFGLRQFFGQASQRDRFSQKSAT